MRDVRKQRVRDAAFELQFINCRAVQSATTSQLISPHSAADPSLSALPCSSWRTWRSKLALPGVLERKPLASTETHHDRSKQC